MDSICLICGFINCTYAITFYWNTPLWQGIILDSLPKVSIIIVNYNGRIFLDRCLSSMKELKYPPNLFEILLIDNSSNDGSTEFVKTNFPRVKIVSLDKNYGFGGGSNRGVKYSNGEYIAFLNNDTEVTDDWLMQLVKASVNHSVPLCASKTLFMDKPYVVEYGGAKFTVNGRGYSIALGKKDWEENRCFYTGYPCAASMLIKRDTFLKLGGFDEDYFACLDDTDLGWRAWLYGYSVLYCSASIVYHVAGGTAGRGRISPLKAFHGTKDSFLNILKNLELKNLVQGLVLAIIYDFVEFLLLIKRRDTECARNKVKAYFWVIKNVSSTIRKRRVIQRKRRVSDKWLFDNGLMASLNEAIHEYLRLSKLNSNASLGI